MSRRRREPGLDLRRRGLRHLRVAPFFASFGIALAQRCPDVMRAAINSRCLGWRVRGRAASTTILPIRLDRRVLNIHHSFHEMRADGVGETMSTIYLQADRT